MQQSDLIGVWKLKSFFLEDRNGNRRYPYGEAALGYLIYTAEGYVSVHVMSAERPEGGSQQYQGGSDAEKIEAAENYGGYVGTYKIQDDHVTHLAELCGFTRLIQSPEKKQISLSSHQLKITYQDTSSGKALDGEAIWERVQHAAH